MGASSSNRVARGCGLAAGTVLVAVVAFVAYALFQLNSTLRDQSPPDVAKIAGSAPVAAADQLAADRMDTDLAEVARAGTGTTLGPTALLDQCGSRATGEWTEVWGPVACTRTVTAYFTFNGDFERQMQDWASALATKGWRGENAYPLSMPLNYYKTMGGKPLPQDPNPNEPYLASDLPSSDELCKPSASATSVCLRFEWAERPRTNVLFLSGGEPGAQTVVRQRHDVDPAQTETADFAGARYVAIVTIADTYYKPSPKPKQTSNPDPSYSPCYSGSHNCD